MASNSSTNSSTPTSLFAPIQVPICCVGCGIPAESYGFLWVASSTRWCHKCVHTHFSYVTALFCVEGRGAPYIAASTSRILERDHKIVWTSAWGQDDNELSSSKLGNGRLYPIVRKLWENQVSRRCLPTLHLLNGKVVAVGEYIPPVCPVSPDMFVDVGTQTSTATQDQCSQTELLSSSHQPCQTTDTGSSSSTYEEEFQELLAELCLPTPPQEVTVAGSAPAPPPRPSPPHLQPQPCSTSDEDMDTDVLLPPPSNLTEYDIVDAWTPSPSPTFIAEEDVLFLCCDDGLDNGLDLF
ncbi:uncharacterized protein LOC122836042 [Gambusia affinis]|uniref:uncharacterized protein LOC122836042 n=1 Tax=Gambusia affinis TaxID=33528 RepID=UPI001CDB8C8C|nr:uncharacterized protein LOC122836042 [Gambusia affinis]